MWRQSWWSVSLSLCVNKVHLCKNLEGEWHMKNWSRKERWSLTCMLKLGDSLTGVIVFYYSIVLRRNPCAATRQSALKDVSSVGSKAAQATCCCERGASLKLSPCIWSYMVKTCLSSSWVSPCFMLHWVVAPPPIREEHRRFPKIKGKRPSQCLSLFPRADDQREVSDSVSLVLTGCFDSLICVYSITDIYLM